MKRLRVFIFFLILSFAHPGFSGEADVVEVKVNKIAEYTYQFNVTVRHSDDGWKH